MRYAHVILIAALFAGSPVAAQFQTVDSAKALLKKTLSGTRFNKNELTLDGREIDSFRSVDEFTGTLGAAQDYDACTLRVAHSRPEFTYQTARADGTPISYEIPFDAGAVTINFTRIGDARADGNRIDYREFGRTRRRALFLADPKVARQILRAFVIMADRCSRPADAS